MQSAQFEQVVEAILKREKRYDPQAYVFLKEALDYTVRRICETNGGEPRHVTGPELCEGFRDAALQEFGPMAATLLQEWGVHESFDIGEMVFLLIEEGAFGKQESDRKEDFRGVFVFEDAFIAPFTPKRPFRSSLSSEPVL